MDASAEGLLWSLLVCFATNWLGFATEDYFDATGLLSAVLAAVASLKLASHAGHDIMCVRPLLAAALVVMWAVRLGGFLYFRVVKLGSDSRFAAFKDDVPSMAAAWTLQGLWIWLDLIPLTLLLRSGNSCSAWSYVDAVGLALWVTGFAVETIADKQKLEFRLDPANKGKFIQSGLWSVVRYPNYAGEILLWIGVVVLCASGMSAWYQILAACIAPLSTAALTLKGSGVPIQEKQALERWGNDADYLHYRVQTPLLIPFFMPSKPKSL